MITVLIVTLVITGVAFFSYKLIRKIVKTPRFQIFGEYVSRVNTSQKVVALTYDDGPNPPFTEDLINLFERLDVRATFFVVGENVEKNPDTAKLLVAKGHELGNHSYSHVHLVGRFPSFVRMQIEKTDSVLRNLGLPKPTHFRSPFGYKFLILPWVLTTMKRKNILWNIDPKDYEAKNFESVVQHIFSRITPGSIILLHDGGGDRSNTVKATEAVVKGLQAEGYEFKTVSELLSLTN